MKCEIGKLNNKIKDLHIHLNLDYEKQNVYLIEEKEEKELPHSTKGNNGSLANLINQKIKEEN